ncbi:hypothetical protein NDU88_004940 [Pleurodeles waltl]|uniref:Uncharacterized protein n=1 Tax=Pleurodeles waltl TaxID=8319 RepID=A0AAV7L2B7_PLEWA|nr:hypothetical protein NDU88_004940 [Pleurodeles waltl]
MLQSAAGSRRDAARMPLGNSASRPESPRADSQAACSTVIHNRTLRASLHVARSAQCVRGTLLRCNAARRGGHLIKD